MSRAMADPYSEADCLARAEQCEREAARAAYEAQRLQLLWLADQWRTTARLAQRISTGGQTRH